MEIDGLAAAYMIERLLDARLVRTPAIVAPAAGAELSIPVPANTYWEILALRFTFTASAVVANRRPALILRDPDNAEYLRLDTRVDVAAAGVRDLQYVSGIGYENTATPALYGLPAFPFPLSQGWTVRTATTAIDVGDTYTGVRLWVRELAPDRIAEQVRRLENDVAGFFGRSDFEYAEEQ